MTRRKDKGDGAAGKSFDWNGIGLRLRAELATDPLTQLASCPTCTGVVRTGCRRCALANAALTVDDLVSRRLKEQRAEDVERLIAEAKRLFGRATFVAVFATKARERVVLIARASGKKPQRRELWLLAGMLAEGGLRKREIAALLEGDDVAPGYEKRVQRWLGRARDARLGWELYGAVVPGNERTPFRFQTLRLVRGSKKEGGHLRAPVK